MQNQIFHFNNQKVRTETINNEPYFCASDVCKILEIKNGRDALKKVEDWDVKKIYIQHPQNKDKQIQMSFVNEKGLLQLILRSNKQTSIFKKYLIDFLIDNKLINNQNVIYSRQEIEFLDTLESILKPFDYKCIRQYKILNYKIDLYIKDLNVVVEYDEKHTHSSDIQQKQDLKRENNIKKELNCKFIRVSNQDSHLWNCGYVMKNLLNILIKQRS